MSRLAVAAALALATVACAGDDGRRNTEAGRDTGAVGTTGVNDGDREFIHEQLTMGHAEIELGRLAQQRANHPEVREYAGMMIRDHRAAGDRLKEIADKADVGHPPARDMDNEHVEFREELTKTAGPDFDRKYMERMVDDHEKAARDLEDKAEKAGSSDVKQWAASTLPKVREHLDKARQIRGALNKDRGY